MHLPNKKPKVSKFEQDLLFKTVDHKDKPVTNRKEREAQSLPNIEVHIHNAPPQVAVPETVINVHTPETVVNVPKPDPTVVNVNVPKQPAPVVTVQPTPVTVNVPAQEAPHVTVNVPPPAPSQPKRIVLDKDSLGRITGGEIRPKEER